MTEEFKMLTDQRFLNRRLQSNRKNLILFTLILAIIGTAYLLVGALGTMVVEENIDSAGEYEAWKGSFWDWAFYLHTLLNCSQYSLS